ncbi:hypothetical protein GCM10017322_31960 [Paracoccus aerius]|nr:hypothetical protein GCM10017322_31960 [Paracoccus aerius]
MPAARRSAGQKKACGRKAAKGTKSKERTRTLARKAAHALHKVGRVRGLEVLGKAADAVGGIVEDLADAGIRVDFGFGRSQGRGKLVGLAGKAAAEAFFPLGSLLLQAVSDLADLLASFFLKAAQGGLVIARRSVVLI